MPKPTSPTDAELCQRARAGDRDAVEALVKRHYAAAVFTARRARPPLSIELDDLIQEGLMGIARSAELWDETKGAAFITYAMRACQNRVRRYLTHRLTRPLTARPTHEDDPLPEERLPPDLKPLLSQLNYTARQVVSMAYGLESSPLPHAEIGERLGLSVPQVKRVLEESIGLLRLVARPAEAA